MHHPAVFRAMLWFSCKNKLQDMIDVAVAVLIFGYGRRGVWILVHGDHPWSYSREVGQLVIALQTSKTAYIL